MAFQIGFDLAESVTQEFLGDVIKRLEGGQEAQEGEMKTDETKVRLYSVV